MSTASLPDSAALPLAGLPHLEGSGQHAHSVQFYADSAFFLDELSRYIGTALMAGDAAVVLATQTHRDGLARRLQSRGLDMTRMIEEGRYIALDAANTLASFMLDRSPDAALFAETMGVVLAQAAAAARENILTLPRSEKWWLYCGSRAIRKGRYGLNNSGTT